MLASYLHVAGCWEECVSLVPTCRWVLVGVGRNVLASYPRVGGCWEECVSLVPTCRRVSGGMC